MSMMPRTSAASVALSPSPWTNPTSIFSSSRGSTRSAANEAARPPSSSERRTPSASKRPSTSSSSFRAGPGPAGYDLERDRRADEIHRAKHRRQAIGELRIVEEPVRDVDRHAEVVARLRPQLGGAQRVCDDDEREVAYEWRALDMRDELGRRQERCRPGARAGPEPRRSGSCLSRDRGSAGRRRGARSARARSRRRGRRRRRRRAG